MDRRQFIAAGALAGLAAAQSSANAATDPLMRAADKLNPKGVRQAGIRMLSVRGGKYKVWTKKMGDGPVKVLLLHGGPGFSHEYLEAMESFLPQAGIEMYYYDQLGSTNSDHPDDDRLWTLPGFVEEVEEVRRGLGLDQFVLYGHSWGGMLGIDYALKYQQHLKGLVISNMTAGIKAYLAHVPKLKAVLKPNSRARLEALEAKQDFDNPDYQKIVMEELYPQILCRLDPWPEPVTRAFNHANLKIYNLMQGKSELEVTGNFKNWERWDRLKEIKVKALTIGSRHDEMDPEDMRKMAKMMPNASMAFCPNGSHLCMWDDQAVYFRNLVGFLKSI